MKLLNSASVDRTAAKSAIDGTTARGDTALYDALYASCEALKTQPGRKAIILLSDGVDDDGTGKQLSKHSLEEGLALAREVNVPVFTIGLGSGIDESVLKKIAEATGAGYFNAPQASELQALYDKIGKQLEGQYNIFYTSNLPADGTEHRIQLRYSNLTAVKSYKASGTSAVAAAPVPVVPATGPAINVAALKNGGKVIEFSGQYNDNSWKVENLLDGGTQDGWCSNGNGPQSVVLGFKDDQVAEIRSITINPYTKEDPKHWVKEIEFFVSNDYSWKGYTSIGKMSVKPEGLDQIFELPKPVDARYLKMMFLSNGGGGYMEAGEIEVEGVLKGEGARSAEKLINYASTEQGGGIEKFTSQYNDNSWAVTNLIDGHIGEGWCSNSKNAQEVIFRFSEPREILELAVNPYTKESPKHWARTIEFSGSAELPNRGYQPLGTLKLGTTEDWYLLTLAQPAKIKYLKAIFRDNDGGSYIEAGEVRAYGR